MTKFYRHQVSDFSLALILIEADNHVFYIHGDYKKLWLLIESEALAPHTTDTQKLPEEIEKFLQYLVAFDYLPDNVNETQARDVLQRNLITAKLTGDYHLEEFHEQVPVYASWSEDAYGCQTVWNPEKTKTVPPDCT